MFFWYVINQIVSRFIEIKKIVSGIGDERSPFMEHKYGYFKTSKPKVFLYKVTNGRIL